MLKTLLINLMLFPLAIGISMAQEKVVSGTVSSAADGSALPGVNVLIKGTSVGSITDVDGKYSLNVPANGKFIVFSYIGFMSEEIDIADRSVINMQMTADIKELTEIVVTAFGIERESKALGYTVQEVKGESLIEARAPNVANGLSGKIAGLTITSNGGPGSGSNILIRGVSSLSGNNQPLIVVDGVPMDQNDDKQFGGGISEISPDNIKDISVLKGANSAALYGSRAANGVILITTKNGKGTKGIGIDYNANMTFERPWIKPKFNDIYGGGNGYRTWYNDGWSGGISDPTQIEQYRAAYGPNAPLSGTAGTDESWGHPMDGRLVRHWWSGTEVAPLTPQPNNWEEFWSTGQSMTHNIALSGGNDQGYFRLSMGRLSQQGISYNNDFYRNNFRINSGYDLTRKLTVALSGEYIKSGADNRSFTQGQQFIWSHRHISWDQHRNYRDYEDVHIQRALPGRLPDNDPPNWQHTFFTNPFYIAENLPLSNEKDRLLGNITLTYEVTPKLNVLLRSGTDIWTDTRINVLAFDRVRNGNRTPGRFSEEVLRRQESNSDMIVTYNTNIGSDFNVNIQGGGIHRTNQYKRNFFRVGELVVDGIYNAANSVPSLNVIESEIATSEVQSLFGAAQFGWRNSIFLDVTARNDWASTLPPDARSYFYPSASLSAVVTDLFEINSSVLSFAKLRAGLAQVGNDTDPYRLAQTFLAQGSWNGSIPQFSDNPTLANSSLKPEITTGLELGADLRFFNGRVSLDVTYYEQSSINQILDIELSKSTGYDRRIINAGEVQNRGIEVMLGATPIKTAKGFTWDVMLNFARNRNKVIELTDGLTSYTIAAQRGLTSEARIGQPFGTLYGVGFERAPDGQMILDNGLPRISTEQRILGNVQPDWTGGFLNTFSYKGIVLTALVDIRIGGDIFDEGTGTGRWTGQYAETAVGREEGVIGKGVKEIVSGDGSLSYVPNDVIVSASQYYGYNNPRRFHEASIYDASYVKLRELSLGYQLPTSLLGNTFIQTAKVSLVGRNVLMLFKNTPHVDPEFDRLGGNAQGFGYGELPSSRSLGMNISLTF